MPSLCSTLKRPAGTSLPRWPPHNHAADQHHIFHLISTALLIPTMLLLLWCLFRALFSVGQFLREFARRARIAAALEGFSTAMDEIASPPPLPVAGSILTETLGRVQQAGGDLLRVERLVHEAELAWDGRLESLRNLVPLGPMLGRMGTLIPLGPALMGLAAGDLQTMASNLIVAFATAALQTELPWLGRQRVPQVSLRSKGRLLVSCLETSCSVRAHR